MRRSTWITLATALALMTSSLAAHGQPPHPRTVVGRGLFELKKQPEMLRVQVEVFAKGKDLKEALAKLRLRRLATQKFLESIGAASNSIEFTEAAVNPEKADRQRRIGMMMMRMRAQQGGKPTKEKPKEAPPILVISNLKAEIKLPAGDAEELLLATHSLEQKIKAADIAGTKDIQQLTPQDEEQAAEEMGEDNDPDARKPGEPMFFYVRKLSEKEHAGAIGQAFKKARRDALQLAVAAGVELGPLDHLESDMGVEVNQGVEDSNSESALMRQFVEHGRMSGTAEENTTPEAIGMQPSKVFFRVALTATFEVKKPQMPK
jgi:uncharacterized protein YggE